MFSYHDLFKAGKDSCRNVRWKHSVQRFEARMFSGTAERLSKVIDGDYEFSPYVHFILNERGKSRPIDAPRIEDRQVEKTYTRKVLLPLYTPSMIHNNGASLPGKGFAFSRKELAKDLREHYRLYGREGWIILTDGRKFFPNANHDKIRERHNRLIFDDALRKFGDKIVDTVKTGVGMPLGVEPSQAEMIAYASDMDNYMTCQMSLRGYGHYMDDFYILVPPDRDPQEIIRVMGEQADRCGLVLNSSKTRCQRLTKPFHYCKTKYILTETGKVITRANRKTMPRYRKKIRALHEKYVQGEMTLDDIWCSVNGMTAYLEQYDEHNHILELRRLFFALFGFSCESYENFRN